MSYFTVYAFVAWECVGGIMREIEFINHYNSFESEQDLINALFDEGLEDELIYIFKKQWIQKK